MKYGFLNINKEKGLTSFDVIFKLRKKLGIKKIGHTGTLDPMATGVLVVAVGEATKLIEFMMKDSKEYSAEITLGAKSDTYDAEGEIEEVDSREPSLEEISKIIEKFVGEIEQIPPKFSAIKIKGKKAYDMARKGEDFEMKSRKVTISSIVIHEYKYPKLKIDINCGSGTYIRSLANDIGEDLGCGAYLSALKRTRAGNFLIKDSIEIEEVDEKSLIPLEAVSVKHKSIEISAENLRALDFGQFIKLDDVKDDTVCAFLNNKLVGIIEKTKEGLYKYKKKINL